MNADSFFNILLKGLKKFTFLFCDTDKKYVAL